MLRMQRGTQINQSIQKTEDSVDTRPGLLPAISISYAGEKNSPIRKGSDSQLYQSYLEQEDSPSKLPGNKAAMTKFFTNKFNRLIPGKSIDVEQQMISEFVRKSKEMDLGVKDFVES